MKWATLLIPILLACITPSLKTDATELSNVVHFKVTYRVFAVEGARVEGYWKNPKTQKPFKRFPDVQEYLADKGRTVTFMMNGGIFEPGLAPSGLYIENAKVLNPINLKTGEGNFYLKPNGVFYITPKGKAGILESAVYVKSKVTARLAIQSGPLLLQNGKIHPVFKKDSVHRRHRNGVGINEKGEVVFAISERGQNVFPTLYEFSKLFQHLNCKNALFLDGDLSTMIVNPKGKIPYRNDFASIIVISTPMAQ